MASDEMELKTADQGGTAANAAPAQQAPAGDSESAPEEDKDKGSRVDAAKAFFRAMYAGDENPDSVQPTDSTRPQAGSAGPQGEVGSCRNCTGMEFSLKEAEAKAAESDKHYSRMAADFDNFRRRMEKQSEESAAAGVRKAVEALLPALDDLDRAKIYLNADTPSDKLLDGFNLIFTRLLQALQTTGVTRIEALGEPFDPRFHEPVQQVTTTDYPDGHVMQELRGGYMMHDKVIRPTLVNVADNPNGAAVGGEGGAAPEAAASATSESAGEESTAAAGDAGA